MIMGMNGKSRMEVEIFRETEKPGKEQVHFYQNFESSMIYYRASVGQSKGYLETLQENE
jgi:hypothetical protein